jgi:cobalt-zinc-cadmium efflux system membrane fusion protein
MNVDADDVHCDSLSGAAMGTEALTIPPSLPPAARRAGHERKVGYFIGGLALSAALVVSLGRAPEAPPSDSLHVEGQTVSYSASFAQRAGIRTVEVRETAFSPVISVTGKTTFDPEHMAAVGASALGTVRRVAKYEGDSVKRGEVLAEIGSPMSARMEAATSLRTREAPQGTLGVSLVRSPLEGTVIERRIVTGQSVRGERVVFVVADLDRLSVDVAVDQIQARVLRVGDRVELLRDGAASGSGSASAVGGSIAWLGALGAADAPPVAVHVGVDNRARTLRLGQAVTARIFASSGARVVVIPNRAVAWIAGQPTVFVSDGHNSVSAAAVTLGGNNGDQTEVQVGLAPGQHIVSDGVRTLKDESFL